LATGFPLPLEGEGARRAGEGVEFAKNLVGGAISVIFVLEDSTHEMEKFQFFK
jgi:hypothetical protein